MKQDDAERHVIFAFSVLLLFFAGFTLFIVSIVRASPVPDSAASSATFHTKCGMCHGLSRLLRDASDQVVQS